MTSKEENPPPYPGPPMYNQQKGDYPRQMGPGYQGMQGTSNVVVVTQPQVMAPHVFQDYPVTMICPHCQAQITTSIHYETGTITWVVCLLLCLFGLWLFCCLIPFCLNACKEAVHTCPNCRNIVGKYNRL